MLNQDTPSSPLERLNQTEQILWQDPRGITEAQVTTNPTGTKWETKEQKIKDAIEAYRVKLIIEAETNPLKKDGLLHRLCEITKTIEGGLTLSLGTCTYAEYFIQDALRRYKWASNPDFPSTNAIVLTSMIHTTDDKWIFGVRTGSGHDTSQMVRLGSLGGVFNADEGANGNPFTQIRTELDEEIGINMTNIASEAVKLTHIIQNRLMGRVLMVFKVDLPMTAAQVIDMFTEQDGFDLRSREHLMLVPVEHSNLKELRDRIAPGSATPTIMSVLDLYV